MDEFALIHQYFSNGKQPAIAKNQSLAQAKNMVLGIGDDAAVFNVPHGVSLVSSHDLLLEGVHFPEDCSPEDVAYKALAVNLSDLAAMGATPHSFSLALSIPEINENWLQAFSNSLFELANAFEVYLLGGDTVRGKRAIGIHINGCVEQGKFLKRSAAQVGDLIVATGYLGLAALGLKHWQGKNRQVYNNSQAIQRFLKPEPRVHFAQALYALGVRTAIDISDGLLADLNHILKASSCSARLDIEKILRHEELKKVPADVQARCILTGGDDYELCFTLAPDKFAQVQRLAEQHHLPLSVIGHIEAANTDHINLIRDIDGSTFSENFEGYNHFKTNQ